MTELKKLAKRYEKILDKLDALNEEAFSLEQEMTWEKLIMAQKERGG